jgi:ferredoxin--NADP+ reductase
LIFQEAGYSTRLLGTLNVGDVLYSLAGPLGHPTHIKNYGKVIIIGGGVGIAEILPVARSLKAVGNKVVSILGARNKDLLILRDEVKDCSDELFLATDDGTCGEKGFVSDVLSRILKASKDYQMIYCVGPLPMMRVVSDLTKPYGVKTIVCLNAIMLDGTGMCGSCRLTQNGETKFCCVDGPEFDSHTVDFDELAKRQKRFVAEEKEALKKNDGCCGKCGGKNG